MMTACAYITCFLFWILSYNIVSSSDDSLKSPKRRKLEPFSYATHSSDARQYLDLKRGDTLQGYKVTAYLGGGAFAKAYRAKQHSDSQAVALKVVRHDPRFQEAALREIEILNDIKSAVKGRPASEVFIRLLSTFDYTFLTPQSLSPKKTWCLVFDLYPMTLYQHFHRHPRPHSLRRTKSIAYQLCLAVDFLSTTLDLIHSDLKPENIVVVDPNTTCPKIKIIDLGSAFRSHDRHRVYIQSRWYRAIEVLQQIQRKGSRGWCKFTSAIDDWSIACTLFEVYTEKPLFTGENTEHMLSQLSHFLKNPNAQLKTRLLKDHPQGDDIKNHPVFLLFVDVLERLLKPLPEQRLRATQALQHEFINKE